MEKTIYLDRSATTPLCDEARKAMIETMDSFGNPSSLHTLGVEAEHIVTAARRELLRVMGRPPLAAASELIFTSGGTESNSTALIGAARSKPAFRGGRIISTASEHPSVIEALHALALDGFDVVLIQSPRGVFDFDAFRAAMTPRVFLVSVMYVNNETGAINPLKEIFAAARAVNPDVICHTDAVQAFCKLPCRPDALGADLMSVSGHKIGAPKGIGALYVSPRVTKAKCLAPFLVGGGQEGGMRSGTENTPGIAAFGAAAGREPCDLEKLARVRGELIAALPDGAIVNQSAGEYYPGILSVTFPGIKSETMLHHLSSRGVYVSSGSACSSHSRRPGRVLLDFGLDARAADCTLRMSFDCSLESEDIATVAEALHDGTAKLQKIR